MKYRSLVLLFLFLGFACKTVKNSTDASSLSQGVYGYESMVVTAHPIATKIGLDILHQGGNAYDAAVAVHFALAVCYPRAGNIGGGGFMISRNSAGAHLALDFREKAPKAATRDMYLDKEGEPIDQLSTLGYLAVGVPGSVAGMVEIHNTYGSLPWKKVVQPAIDLAKNGFALTKAEAEKLNEKQEFIAEANPTNSVIFLKNKHWQEGEQIRIPELAKTLSRIQEFGFDGFYKGETAKEFARQMSVHGGLITEDDLANYTAKWRTPLSTDFQGYQVYSMPPPSSGGVALIQLLYGTELFIDQFTNHNSTASVHLMTELERRVYADRATYLGDSDFVSVPLDDLLSKPYLKEKFSDIDLHQATPSEEIKQGGSFAIESFETTHYSIVDKEGNAVAITTTLNGSFGSKVYLSNLGFFLNNEMDDFSMKPGVPNMFGLVGSEANKIEAEKRMLSSMTPTIVDKDGELFMVLGTPGGSTIITSVYQSLLNVILYKMSMQEAVNAQKVHSQWLPDKIHSEPNALSQNVIDSLSKMGHTIEFVDAIGRVDAILYHQSKKQWEGAADPRGDDKAAGM